MNLGSYLENSALGDQEGARVLWLHLEKKIHAPQLIYLFFLFLIHVHYVLYLIRIEYIVHV